MLDVLFSFICYYFERNIQERELTIDKYNCNSSMYIYNK